MEKIQNNTFEDQKKDQKKMNQKDLNQEVNVQKKSGTGKKEQRKAKRQEIAARLYQLDGEVYETLGSNLGRTFTGDPDKCIRSLRKLLAMKTKEHVFRSEMALVSNMAQTIEDDAVRTRLLAEYDSILAEVNAYTSARSGSDILDEERASLNVMNFNQKFSADDRLVICISRTAGSAGNDIGFALASVLHINYYDEEILRQMMTKKQNHELNVDESKIDSLAQADISEQKLDLNPKHILADFDRYHGLSRRDAYYFNMSDMIREIAGKEDCVIVGRCADSILQNNGIPHVSIFIDAPFLLRVQREMDHRKLDYKKAVKYVKKMDKRHRDFYNFYSNGKWGKSDNYDLSINSANYGIHETVNLILRMITHPTADGVRMTEDHKIVNC